MYHPLTEPERETKVGLTKVYPGGCGRLGSTKQ